MWKDKLEAIKQEKKIYDELINDGAIDDQINNFKIEVQNLLHYTLPEDYINFLKVVNGLEFNGFIIYGIDDCLLDCNINQPITGLISSNKIWYENEAQKQYVFLGESNISWYCFDLKSKEFVELDNPSGTFVLKYDRFEGMVEKILEDSLR